jgi:hypothetical protein
MKEFHSVSELRRWLKHSCAAELIDIRPFTEPHDRRGWNTQAVYAEYAATKGAALAGFIDKPVLLRKPSAPITSPLIEDLELSVSL